MADVSDPAISAAYQAIRSDSDPTEWVVIYYVSGDKLAVRATGSGGFDEVADQFKDDECAYAYVRVTTGDAESKRAKFVFVAWTGESAGILRKAKVSVHKANVKSVFRDFAVEVHAAERDDLNHEKVLAVVKKAGGANYMGQES
ncbi:Drebrins and related actin binding protein [Balamuthia mandrillaris]